MWKWVSVTQGFLLVFFFLEVLASIIVACWIKHCCNPSWRKGRDLEMLPKILATWKKLSESIGQVLLGLS